MTSFSTELAVSCTIFTGLETSSDLDSTTFRSRFGQLPVEFPAFRHAASNSLSDSSGLYCCAVEPTASAWDFIAPSNCERASPDHDALSGRTGALGVENKD